MIGSRARDLLTAFSPSLDYLAIISGDGRIKIWDTVKGQLQMEFSDVASATGSSRFFASEESRKGHLSLDYTCMAWLPSDQKKKRKSPSSLLVLGTGSGDVFALDVFSGQLRWALNDCHPGGVTALSFSCQESCIYSAGADRVISRIESQSGDLKDKFKGSSKGITSISISPDGEKMAIASAHLKISTCADHKKIQKFSGHPVAVLSTCFSDDAKYIVSCGSGERYVALWGIDGSKNSTSICLLVMEHLALSIDCKISKKEMKESCFCVLALSEIGECYVWYGQTIEELRNSKPGKVSLSSDGTNNHGSLPMILSAKLMGHSSSTEVHVFITYGLVVKPLFQKIVVKPGDTTILHVSQEGILLPLNQKSNRSLPNKHGGSVTALDSSNVDEALLPSTKISDISKIVTTVDTSDDFEDYSFDDEIQSSPIEQQLRQLEVFDNINKDYASLNDIILESSASEKKIRTAALSMDADFALDLLEILIMTWRSRSFDGKSFLPWIRNILVFHGQRIMEKGKLENHLLDSLSKICKSRETTIEQFLQLSGRLQLITTQIAKGSTAKIDGGMEDVYVDEEEDNEVEELIYGEEEESELSSDDDV